MLKHSCFIVIWISHPKIDVTLRSHIARPDYLEKWDRNLEKGIVVQTWLFFQEPGGFFKISVQIYQPSSSSLFSWAKIYKNKSKPSVRQFAFFLFKTILDNYFYLSLIVSNCLLLLAFSQKSYPCYHFHPIFHFLTLWLFLPRYRKNGTEDLSTFPDFRPIFPENG